MNLQAFFAEKDFEIRTYEVTSPTTGDSHIVTTDVVIRRILSTCLLYTSPSPRDVEESRMPSSA